jgi:hypothetical protein
MSFIRAGEQGSDVYVYPAEVKDGSEVYVCCWPMSTKRRMAAHLRWHVEAGDCVPQKTFDELEAWDRETYGLRVQADHAARGLTRAQGAK